jgi:hypothetical protein
LIAATAFVLTAASALGADDNVLVITKGPYLQSPGPGSMTICWEYTPPVPPPWQRDRTKAARPAKKPDPETLPSFRETDRFKGAVRYGIDGDLTQRVEVNRSVETQYLWRKGPVETVYLFSCVLEGLTPGTRYDYQVETEGRTSDPSHFRTPARDTDTFTFVAYGNTKFGIPHRETGLVIERENPDFVLNTGNMVTDGRNYWEWEETYFKPLAGVIDHIPVWPVMGGSDRRGSRQAEEIYRRLFSLPGNELRYAFDYGSARFVCLDDYRMARNPEDAAWCEQALKGSDAFWKFVLAHQPPFVSTARGGGSRNEKYISVFQHAGVDVHISGRPRFYQRFQPLYLPGTDPRSAVAYVITGAATWGLDDPAPHPAVAAAAKKRHYMVFEVDGTALAGRAVGLDGEILDSFTIERSKDGSYAESHVKNAREADAGM